MRDLTTDQDLLDAFFDLMPSRVAPKAKRSHHQTNAASQGDVNRLLAEAQQHHLWDGVWNYGDRILGQPYPSQSEADFELLRDIVHHAAEIGVPIEQVEDATVQVFKQSGLYREEKLHRVLTQDIPNLLAAHGGLFQLHNRLPGTPRLKGGRIGFSNTLPAPRDYVLGDIILAAKPCVLAGLGGASKTMWLMMLAVSVALGRDFIGKPTKLGCVLLILGEEDQDEIDRRFNAIASHLGLSEAEIKTVQHRVLAFPLVGEDARFTASNGKAVVGTDFPEEIIKAAQDLELDTGLPIALIGLDHAGLLHGGDFNAREDVVQTITQVWKVTSKTGAATLTLAHSPKAAVGKDEADSNDVAGSKAWVDHTRGSFVLRGMSLAESKELGINADARGNYVSLTSVKANYGPTGLKVWMQRITMPEREVSVLEHVQLTKQKTVNSRSSHEVRIKDFIRQRPGEFTITSLRETEGGKDGRFKAGKHLVASVAKDLVASKELELVEPTQEQRQKHNLRDPRTRVLVVNDDCEV